MKYKYVLRKQKTIEIIINTILIIDSMNKKLPRKYSVIRKNQ